MVVEGGEIREHNPGIKNCTWVESRKKKGDHERRGSNGQDKNTERDEIIQATERPFARHVR